MCINRDLPPLQGDEPNQLYNQLQYSCYYKNYQNPDQREKAVKSTYPDETLIVKTYMSRIAIYKLTDLDEVHWIKPGGADIKGIIFTFCASGANNFIICASPSNSTMTYVDGQENNNYRHDRPGAISIEDVRVLRQEFKMAFLNENLTPDDKDFSFSSTQLLRLLEHRTNLPKETRIPLELVLIPNTIKGIDCPYFNLVIKNRGGRIDVNDADCAALDDAKAMYMGDDGTGGSFYACPTECY